MSDSDQSHRAVRKNGHDQKQDHELRDLKDAVNAQKQADIQAHANILTKLNEFNMELALDHVREEEKAKAEKSLRSLVFKLTAGFVAIIIALASAFIIEVRDIHQAVNNNTTHFKEFQAIGIEMKVALDATDEDIQQDLRQLRDLVQRHQINKDEHNHPKH